MSFKNYKYVTEYNTTATIPESIIHTLLKQTWKLTPSKNNFMPYSVHVVGGDHQKLKTDVYNLCVKNEAKANEMPDIEIIKYFGNYKPQYWNIVTCSYLLVFTPRLATEVNPWQDYCIENHKNSYEQMNTDMNAGRNVRLIEIGMFSTIFASLCLKSNLDISHTMCFSSELEDWHNIGFSDIEYLPALLMSVGKGRKYRQPVGNPIEKLDLKPDFTKIVNFIK